MRSPSEEVVEVKFRDWFQSRSEEELAESRVLKLSSTEIPLVVPRETGEMTAAEARPMRASCASECMMKVR